MKTGSINYGKSLVTLGDGWRTHCEMLPGVRMLGTIQAKNGHVAGLGVNESGDYLAINGRYCTLLVARKIEAAILEARTRQDAQGFGGPDHAGQ